jgi:hypothetical protein
MQPIDGRRCLYDERWCEMTTARNDETTNEPELVHVEMEIAGPPGRPGRTDAATPSRRRRLLGALVVATFVVLAIIVAATGWPVDDATTPTPSDGTPHGAASDPAPISQADGLDTLPQGLPPRVPYLLEGTLHVDELTVPTDANRLLSAGDTVLVGRTGEDSARWWLLDGAELVPEPDLDGVRTPVLAPSGGVVAWTAHPDSRTTRIVAWDPGTRSGIGHVDLDAPYAECCGGGQLVELLGFDREDQLFLTDRGHDLQWRPDGGVAPRPVTRVPDMITDRTQVWSSDGRLAATAPWVLDPVAGTRTRLAVPDGHAAESVAFESDQWVLGEVVVRPRRHELLRCAVRDGSCERALPTGTARWLLPERSPS